MLRTKTRCIRLIALLLLAAMLMPALTACADKNRIEIPEGLTREEQALYTAVAKVCPKSENHSKVEYLCFYIEGWSFDKMPEAVNSYLSEYCAAGQAVMLQFDRDKLEELGYIKKGEADTFYEEDDEVFAEGRGKIFTFTLKDGQSTDADECIVSVDGFISTHDHSGYDVALKYENGAWQFVRYENAWNAYQFVTQDPNATYDPEK